MGRRSRRKVDAVIGVALVLGLIGSEMRPDGAIAGGKTPSVLEKSDTEIQSAETSDTTDHVLLEELARINGLDENTLSDDKGGIVLPVIPMASQKQAVRPDHCYSSFASKDLVKTEPTLLWQVPQNEQVNPDPTEVVDHYPVTDAQFLPSAYEALNDRVGYQGRSNDLQVELADLVAAVQPSSCEQSPFPFTANNADPEELFKEILHDADQLGFGESPVPAMSPKTTILAEDPSQFPSLIDDPEQDIFRWMDQSNFEANDCASSSHASDFFGLGSMSPSSSPEQCALGVRKDLPAAESDRTIDELLSALERNDNNFLAEKLDFSSDPLLVASPNYDVVPVSKTLLPTEVINSSASNRKRKSDVSTSPWSSGASSCSTSGAVNADYHNHTYEDNFMRRAKSFKPRSGLSIDDAGGAARCRDVTDFMAMKIPYDYESVVSSEPSSFNTMVNDRRLNDEQRTLMRAARRRAKNRNAARQCRQRRVDEVEELAEEVQQLESERNNAVAEMNEIDTDIEAQRSVNDRLRVYIIQTYTRMRPLSSNDVEYQFHSSRNGSLNLVEQRSIKA